MEDKGSRLLFVSRNKKIVFKQERIKPIMKKKEMWMYISVNR